MIYDTTDLEELTQLFIRNLERKTLQRQPSIIISEDILGKLQNGPERTTTAPSAIHLGHYHAAWKGTGCKGGAEEPKGQAILDAQVMLLIGTYTTTTICNLIRILASSMGRSGNCDVGERYR